MVILVLLFCCIGPLYAHIVTPEQLQKVNAILEKNADNVDALLLRAHYYVNNGKYETALPDMEHVLCIYRTKNEVPPANVSLSLASMYFKVEQFDRALEIYNLVLTPDFCRQFQNHKPVQEAMWERAVIYCSREEYELAWQDAQRVLKALDNHISVLGKSAEIAEKAGKREEAIRLYCIAILKYPSAGCENWLSRALTLMIEGRDFVGAVRLLDALALELPESPLAHYYRGLLARYYLKDASAFEQDMQQALQCSQQIAQEEDIVQGEFWQTRILLAMDRPQEALDAINRAIAEESDHPALFQLRACAYNALGMHQIAEEDMQTWKRLSDVRSEDWLELFSIPLGE